MNLGKKKFGRTSGNAGIHTKLHLNELIIYHQQRLNWNVLGEQQQIWEIALTIQEFISMWDFFNFKGLALTEPLKLHVLSCHVLEFCQM